MSRDKEEVEVINQIYADEIRAAIAEMPNANHREILKLLFYEGFSYSQTAKQLNIPDGTVRSRADTAKKKLKEILIKKGIPDNWR